MKYHRVPQPGMEYNITRRTLMKIGAVPAPRPLQSSHGPNGANLQAITTSSVSVQQQSPPSSPPQTSSCSACLFAYCVCAFLATGISLCAMHVGISDSTPNNNHLHYPYCFRTMRKYHYIAAKMYIGNSAQGVSALMRLDRAINCSVEEPLVLFQQRILSDSLSVKCEGSICTDTVYTQSFNAGGSNQLYGVRYRYGSQHLSDHEAYSLGLDGELFMCLGRQYTFDADKVCWTNLQDDEGLITNTSPPPADPSSSSSLSLEMTPEFKSSPCQLETFEGEGVSLPNYCVDQAACTVNRSSSIAIAIFPVYSYDITQLTGMSSAEMTRVLNFNHWKAHIDIASVGVECAASKVVHAEYVDIFRTLCRSNDYRLNKQCYDSEPILPFTSVARNTLVFTLPMWSDHATLAIQKNMALRSHLLEGEYDESANWNNLTWPIVRLVVITLAAAIMYVRRRETNEDKDALFVSCIQWMKRHNTSRSTPNGEEGIGREDDHHSEMDHHSSILGVIAIVSRGFVVTLLTPTLWSSNYELMVVLQFACILASLIQWSVTLYLRYYYYSPSLNNMRLIMGLGGSSALIDITAATLTAYSVPPIRTDQDGFSAVARLLTSTLMMLMSTTRCFFSSACAGLLSNTLASFAVASYWVLQAITNAFMIVQFFVIPAGYDSMRAHAGNWQLTMLAIFCTLCAIVGPKLTANAKIIFERRAANSILSLTNDDVPVVPIVTQKASS